MAVYARFARGAVLARLRCAAGCGGRARRREGAAAGGEGCACAPCWPLPTCGAAVAVCGAVAQAWLRVLGRWARCWAPAAGCTSVCDA